MTAEEETPPRPPHRWRPIEDLPADRSALRRATSEVAGLRRAWAQRRADLETSGALLEFNRRLVRSWCIETGVIEGIYSVSRGLTQTLVERGFDEALVSHGDTNVPAAHLIDVLRDHERAVEGLFAFVKSARPLSTSYVKELHQALTAHQTECDGVDQFGIARKVALLRGDWKRLPNNPGRGDTFEVVHEYCPPEHVASEMDRLIALHLTHADVEPEVEAAWLHHRFTQIHPFQDGNGRVARALASLVLIRGGGFPFSVVRDGKSAYIDALRTADDGDLLQLVAFVCRVAKEHHLSAIDAAGSAAVAPRTIDAILADASERLRVGARRRPDVLVAMATVLRERANQTMDRVGALVRAAIRAVPATDIYRASGEAPPRGQWTQFVTSTAEHLGYHPAPDSPIVFTTLGIRHTAVTEITVAFSLLTESDPLVMAGCAFVTSWNPNEGPASRSEPACTEPFTFTADRDPAELGTAFDEWLERALALGLEIWRRHL